MTEGLLLVGSLLLAVGVVCVALTLFFFLQDGDTASLWFVPAGLLGVALSFPVLHAGDDRGRAERNEQALLSADQFLATCQTEMTVLANDVREWQLGDVPPEGGTRRDTEEMPDITVRQASTAVCVFSALSTLADDLKCRVNDVGLPSDVAVSLAEALRVATAVVDLSTVKPEGRLVEPVGMVTLDRMLADDSAFPVLSNHDTGAWVLWPNNSSQLTVSLPTEPEFHEHCRHLADQPNGIPWQPDTASGDRQAAVRNHLPKE